MKLTIEQWDVIKKIFQDAFNSSFHYAIATVNIDGTPHVTPIGSLMLGEDRKGFYFEGYVSALSRNLQHNKRVCVLAVNSGAQIIFSWKNYNASRRTPHGDCFRTAGGNGAGNGPVQEAISHVSNFQGIQSGLG